MKYSIGDLDEHLLCCFGLIFDIEAHEIYDSVFFPYTGDLKRAGMVLEKKGYVELNLEYKIAKLTPIGREVLELYQSMVRL